MVKLWHGEEAQWQIGMRLGGRKLALEMGDEPRQLFISVGELEAPETEPLRRAAAKAVKSVRSFGGTSALLDVSGILEAHREEGLSALAQGAALALYRREDWKQAKEDPEEEAPFTLYLSGADGQEETLSEAQTVARWICFARDLVNRPGNKLTPAMLSQRIAGEAEKLGVEVRVLTPDETRALGMEAYHAVGDSSANPPRLTVLRWKGGKEGEAPVALVGKGVTFDSGGYSLKPASSMRGMNGDMAGGAAVSAALFALAENRVPVNVTAVVPAVENRISPESFLPSDVIGSMSGKTIEIGSTDAEGRLILADAITYAIEKEHACKVVDIATLTGAIARMLGSVAAGVMANDDGFFADLQAAAAAAGEKYWRMPDYPEYKKLIESPVADLYNSSDGCGAIAAGMFLGAFAQGTPWLHLDIAGTSSAGKSPKEYQAKGATGMGVGTLYRLCRNLAKEG